MTRNNGTLHGHATLEEIALCKAWIRVSKYIIAGNTRKEVGFWIEILEHMQKNCPISRRRTYDMINGK